MRICKYGLPVHVAGPRYHGNTCRILMPKGSQVLSVAEQEGQLRIWAVVDPEAELVHREFHLFRTRSDIPDNWFRGMESLNRPPFLGTVVMPTQIVWHVFVNLEDMPR